MNRGKVWIVQEWTDDGYTDDVLGVFSSLEKAEAFAARCRAGEVALSSKRSTVQVFEEDIQ